MARMKSPKRQSKTVGLAKLAEELRYEWRRKNAWGIRGGLRAAETAEDAARADREAKMKLTTGDTLASSTAGIPGSRVVVLQETRHSTA